MILSATGPNLGEWAPLLLLAAIIIFAFKFNRGTKPPTLGTKDGNHLRRWIRPFRQQHPIVRTDVPSGVIQPVSSIGLDPTMSIYCVVGAMLISGLLWWLSLSFLIGKLVESGLWELAHRILVKEAGWTFSIGFVGIFGLLYLLGVAWHVADVIDPDRPPNESFTSSDPKTISESLQSGSGYLHERVRHLDESIKRGIDLPSVRQAVAEIISSDEDACARSLIAVEWCEAALPAMGFLGTVWGMGQALPQLTNLIPSATDTATSSQDSLRAALSSLAVAFDTTLVGLAFLIPVGFFHQRLRKRMAACLAKSREAMQLYLSLKNDEILTSGSNDQGMAEVMLQLADVRQKLDSLVRFESIIFRMIESGAGGNWGDIRKVLTRNVVSFEKEANQHQEARDRLIASRIGKGIGWKIPVVGMSCREKVGEFGIAVVQDLNGSRMFLHMVWCSGRTVADDSLLEVDADSANIRLTHLVADPEAKCALGVTGEGGVVLIKIPEGALNSVSKVRFEKGKFLSEQASVIFMSSFVCTGVGYLLVFAFEGTKTSVRCVPISMAGSGRTTGRSAGGILRNFDDPGSGRLAAFHRPTLSGFLLLKQNDDRHWVLRSFSISQGKSDQPVAREADDWSGDLWLGSEPVRMEALEAKRILLVLKDGSVVEMRDTRIEAEAVIGFPFKTDQTRFFANGCGWTAVVCDNRMSMWNVRNVGRLEKYGADSGPPLAFEVGSVRPESFQVTADGGHMVAVAEINTGGELAPLQRDQLVVWRFPKSGLNL